MQHPEIDQLAGDLPGTRELTGAPTIQYDRQRLAFISLPILKPEGVHGKTDLIS